MITINQSIRFAKQLLVETFFFGTLKTEQIARVYKKVEQH